MTFPLIVVDVRLPDIFLLVLFFFSLRTYDFVPKRYNRKMEQSNIC
jgi:hypothetical protein